MRRACIVQSSQSSLFTQMGLQMQSMHRLPKFTIANSLSIQRPEPRTFNKEEERHGWAAVSVLRRNVQKHSGAHKRNNANENDNACARDGKLPSCQSRGTLTRNNEYAERLPDYNTFSDPVADRHK